jgi:hypothetical protein
VEGVHQRAEGGEAGLDGVGMWERHEREPGEEQARTDIRVEEQAQVVEVVFPARASIPGGVGLQGGGGSGRGRNGRWLRGGGA